MATGSPDVVLTHNPSEATLWCEEGVRSFEAPTGYGRRFRTYGRWRGRYSWTQLSRAEFAALAAGFERYGMGRSFTIHPC